jgi:hypothetical protein
MAAVSRNVIVSWIVLLFAVNCPPVGWSQEAKTKTPASAEGKTPPIDTAKLKQVSPDAAVWIDKENKRVIVEGQVCLTRGLLEMFACPRDTKEHESIVSVNAKAYLVHAALLALGAKQGQPVRFDPQYVPASGARVDVFCFWTDDQGNEKQVPAQEWIRNLKTKKPMEYHWVFAGSDFWLDESTGKRHYLGDAGDFICVSNFPSATLDLPVKSPQDNENLLHEAFTEKIPPRGTKVTLALVPRLEKDAKKTGKEASKAVKK